MGHSRQILQMDLGGIPHREVLRSIELLGTKVAPRYGPNWDEYPRGSQCYW